MVVADRIGFQAEVQINRRGLVVPDRADLKTAAAELVKSALRKRARAGMHQPFLFPRSGERVYAVTRTRELRCNPAIGTGEQHKSSLAERRRAFCERKPPEPTSGSA